MIDGDGLSEDDHTIAIVESRDILAFADGIEVNDSSNGGRPLLFGPYCLVLVHVLAKRVYGGKTRKAIRQLKIPRNWAWLQSLVKETYPDRPDIWLPDRPVLRHHYSYFRDRYLTTDDTTAALDNALICQGVVLAKALGLCQPGGSINNPTREMVVVSDGKRISPISSWRPGTPAKVDTVTGEILSYRRADADTKEYTEGGEKHAQFGHRYLTASTRGDGYYERAILGIRPAPDKETEALHALIATLNTMLSIGIVAYDAAHRGNSINDLLRSFGILSLSPVTAKQAATKDKPRIDHKKPVERLTVKNSDGETRVLRLGAYRGAACEIVKTEDGSEVYEPLAALKLELRKNSDGTSRLYGIYKTADNYVARVALYNTAADIKKGLNRTEYLRPWGMDNDVYRAFYPQRGSQETIHRQYEDAFWQKRANVYGQRRVYVDLLGWAIGDNAIADYIRRLKTVAPPGAVAA